MSNLGWWRWVVVVTMAMVRMAMATMEVMEIVVIYFGMLVKDEKPHH